nr:putative ribonuclease H-like domain-containing protein [Tanacetum cinerariifolium]
MFLKSIPPGTDKADCDPEEENHLIEKLLDDNSSPCPPKESIDYEEVFAPVARIKAIRLFLAYASFMGFLVYQMDIKSAFLYGTIEEKVYVCQPPGFEDPKNLDKVYKVVKALYGLHQAPRALYGLVSGSGISNLLAVETTFTGRQLAHPTFKDGWHNSSIVRRSGTGGSPFPLAAISKLLKRVGSVRDLLLIISFGLSRGGKRFLVDKRFLHHSSANSWQWDLHSSGSGNTLHWQWELILSVGTLS